MAPENGRLRGRVMKKIRVTAAASLTMLLFAVAGQTAFAGEWKGNDSGTTPVKDYTAASICSFNGQDAPDGNLQDPDFDDAEWALTPAGGEVQAGGQFVAMYANMGLVADAVAAGEFQGFGAECQPGGGEE